MEDKLDGGRLFVVVAGRPIEVPRHPSAGGGSHSKGRFTDPGYTSGFVDDVPNSPEDGP